MGFLDTVASAANNLYRAPDTNTSSLIFSGRMLFLTPNQQCERTTSSLIQPLVQVITTLPLDTEDFCTYWVQSDVFILSNISMWTTLGKFRLFCTGVQRFRRFQFRASRGPSNSCEHLSIITDERPFYNSEVSCVFEGKRGQNSCLFRKLGFPIYGLYGQHQDVDSTPRGRVNQNDRGQR